MSDVIFAASGADVAGEHALVLVTGRGGDLSWVVAVASSLGCVPSAEGVPGELVWVESGRAGAFLLISATDCPDSGADTAPVRVVIS